MHQRPSVRILVAKASPDGYTCFCAHCPMQQSQPLKSLPYDTQRDFLPITLTAKIPSVLVVNVSLAAKSVKELSALSAASAKGLSYSSSGQRHGRAPRHGTPETGQRHQLRCSWPTRVLARKSSQSCRAKWTRHLQQSRRQKRMSQPENCALSPWRPQVDPSNFRKCLRSRKQATPDWRPTHGSDCWLRQKPRHQSSSA